MTAFWSLKDILLEYFEQLKVEPGSQIRRQP